MEEREGDKERPSSRVEGVDTDRRGAEWGTESRLGIDGLPESDDCLIEEGGESVGVLKLFGGGREGASSEENMPPRKLDLLDLLRMIFPFTASCPLGGNTDIEEVLALGFTGERSLQTLPVRRGPENTLP